MNFFCLIKLLNLFNGNSMAYVFSSEYFTQYFTQLFVLYAILFCIALLVTFRFASVLRTFATPEYLYNSVHLTFTDIPIRPVRRNSVRRNSTEILCPDTFPRPQGGRVTCECGENLTKTSLRKHLTSDKHKVSELGLSY